MGESSESSAVEPSPLAADLLELYDEMTDFNDRCAFLCDAFAALAASEQGMDSSTVEGLRSLAGWMKDRMAALKDRLKEIHSDAAELRHNAPLQ